MIRNKSNQDFLTSLEDAFSATSVSGQGRIALDKIFAALRTPGSAGSEPSQRIPVCRFLDDALTLARNAPPPWARLANAFAVIEPSVRWMQRHSSGPFASESFQNGHANTVIIGASGLEDRQDVIIGASLLAPHVRYPDHSHPPEEVYLVLSPGRFRHGHSEWFEPGIGGTLYNEPNINHAMASDAAPLLAFWCLLNATGAQ